MFNVGGGELLVIMLVALVILGPTRLPEAARQVGKIMGEFRKVSTNFQREMREAMNDPVGKALGADAASSDPFNQAASSAASGKADPSTPAKTLPGTVPAEPSEVSADVEDSRDTSLASSGIVDSEQE